MNRLNLTWINLNRLKRDLNQPWWFLTSQILFWDLRTCPENLFIILLNSSSFVLKQTKILLYKLRPRYLFNSINYLFIIIFREIVIAWCSSSVFYLINPPWPGSRKVFWMSSDTRCHEISLKKKVIIRIIHICATTLGTHFSRVSRLELTLEFILKRMSLNRCRGN